MTISAAFSAARLAAGSPSRPSSPSPISVSQRGSAITPNLLILGGTLEATALARTLSARPVRATISLAGRVAKPKPQPLPSRVGGFGGVAGLQSYLRNHEITHVIDATHPFASQMSRNAVTACAACNLPLLAFTRAPWEARHGDRWQHVPDLAGAVSALDGAPRRVFLAVGRMHLDLFAAQPQHHYLLRLVDPPADPLPLDNTTVIVDRGPFRFEDDLALLQAAGVEVIVSKNAGGSGAIAKISAARALGLPVIMIDRPNLPRRREAHGVDAVLHWLSDHGIDLGV